MAFDVTFPNLIDAIPQRVYAQYRDKAGAVAWYKIIPTIGTDLYNGFNQIRSTYDIDISEGVQLDIIGRIVDVGRGLITEQPLVVAQAGDDINAQAGDDINAVFSPLSVGGDLELSDQYFRRLIRWKIARNNSDATIEGIIAAIREAIPDSSPVVVDNEDMSFSIEFIGELTDIDRNILDGINVVPKPQGVRFDGYIELDDLAYFGDDEAEFGDDVLTEYIGLTV